MWFGEEFICIRFPALGINITIDTRPKTGSCVFFLHLQNKNVLKNKRNFNVSVIYDTV